MYSLDALEAINVDQLVTATDRVLLRCKHLVQRPGSRATIDFTREAAAALAASRARAAKHEVADEKTVFVREMPERHYNVLGAVALIAGAWLGVVCACLLT